MKTKKFTNYVALVLLACSFAHVQALTPKKGNQYQEELQSLKKSDLYKTILDRKANGNPRNILTNIENAKKLGRIARWLRTSLLMQDPIVISKKSMPQLYSYVKSVCKKQHMRMPTIFITKNKTSWFGSPTTHTDSTKVLTSSGAILIGQDLLLNVSPQALEAAIAYQLYCIKNNHGNKNVLIKAVIPTVLTPSTLMASTIASRLKLPPLVTGSLFLTTFSFFPLPQILPLGKYFEWKADRFVCTTMGNAQGLIELCSYWQQEEQKVDADYNDTYTDLKNADISFLDYASNGMSYLFGRTGHRIFKAGRFIRRKTFGPHREYQARINTAKKYQHMQNKA